MNLEHFIENNSDKKIKIRIRNGKNKSSKYFTYNEDYYYDYYWFYEYTMYYEVVKSTMLNNTIYVVVEDRKLF